MPVVKDVLTKRFWLSAAIILGISVVIDGVGAFIFSGGIIPLNMAQRWAWIAWAIGGFLGGRFAVRGKEATVPRALLVALTAYGIAVVIGCVIPGNYTLSEGWVGNAVGVAVGALIAGIMKPGKTQRTKGKRGKQKHGKSR